MAKPLSLVTVLSSGDVCCGGGGGRGEVLVASLGQTVVLGGVVVLAGQ